VERGVGSIASGKCALKKMGLKKAETVGGGEPRRSQVRVIFDQDRIHQAHARRGKWDRSGRPRRSISDLDAK